MKAWITKHALTAGVLEVNGTLANTSPEMFCYTVERSGKQYAHGKGRDWHITKEGALKRAEAMRLAKITSLLKRLEKLRDMEFIKPKEKP